MSTRNARAIVVAAVAATLGLAGCGDVSQQDITDMLDQAGKAREQFDKEYGEDLDKIFEELQSAQASEDAKREVEQWSTRPEPPPYTPTSADTAVSDGQAIERAQYPKEAYEDIVAHYADELGIDMASQGGAGEQGTTLDNDEGTYIVVDNTASDAVQVTVIYSEP